MSKDKAPRLELSIETTADAEQVWAALTEPKRLADWFPLHSSGESKAGGKVLLSWGPACEWETHITEFDPNRHLQWMDILPGEGVAKAALPTVDFQLETSGGKTVLRLVQSGFDPDSNWQDYYDAVRRGWLYFLDLLSSYLEHNFDKTRHMVWLRGKTIPTRLRFYPALLGALGMTTSAREDLARVGDRVRLQLDDQPPVIAEVRHAEPNLTFSARIAELGHASLFVEIEGKDDHPTCGIWLSTYGLPAPRIRALEAGLKRICKGLLKET